MATKSSVISGMGVALSVVQLLVGAVKKNGGTDEDIHRLTTTDANGVWDKIASLVIEAGKKGSQVFTLVVDYGRSVKDGVKAGSYDYANPDITEEHFPANKDEQDTKEQTFALYHFGKVIHSDDVIAQMEKDGKRPATLRELFAFGAKNPELQKEFPIIELGSFWVSRVGDRCVAYLSRCSSERSLGLDWYGHSWLDHCRFLGVGK